MGDNNGSRTREQEIKEIESAELQAKVQSLEVTANNTAKERDDLQKDVLRLTRELQVSNANELEAWRQANALRKILNEVQQQRRQAASS